MNERILITGGAGFIGMHLARHLAQVGYTIVLVDNYARGIMDSELQALISLPGISFREVDLMEKKSVLNLGTDYLGIFHLAAIVGVKHVVQSPYKVLVHNTKMLDNIIELARKMIRLSGLTEKTNINKLNGDIEIKYIGLRPGEKMYEELLIDKSSFQTLHPDIMMAKENFLKFQDFSTIIEDLTIAVNNNDNIKIIDLLVKNCEGFKSGK